jgi:hypothetical protein
MRTPRFQLSGKPLGFPVKFSRVISVGLGDILNYPLHAALTGQAWNQRIGQLPYTPSYLLTSFLKHPLITSQILGDAISKSDIKEA